MAKSRVITSFIFIGTLLALFVLSNLLPLPSSTPQAVAKTPHSVVFVTIETLRADHLRTYGYGRNTMPMVEDLAREGITYEEAIVAAPWTLPSVTSILTGLAPSVHGVTEYKDVLTDEVTTLAERFQAAGYQTAFFGVNSLFEADRNLEQGFDHYFGIDEIPGTQLDEELQGFLRHREDPRPLFLYVHYFEPHCQYIPPEPYRELYWPVGGDMATGKQLDDRRFRSMHECFQLHRRSGEPIYELDYYLAEYDAEIRWVDHLVGLLFERLKTANLYDDSLIAILGDHGEEFWETDQFGHGKNLREAVLRVPLILRPPGGTTARRVQAPVSTLDLAPTALDTAGLPVGDRMQGRSLVDTFRGPEPQDLMDRPVFSETDYEGHRLRSVHLGPYKAVLPLNGGQPRLSQWRSDPLAQHNLAAENPQVLRPLLEALDTHQRAMAPLADAFPHAEAPIDQEVMESLRALGYTF